MANQITVNVVSAEKEIWSGKADMLVAKTAVGEIGLLAGHEPMLAVLVQFFTHPESDRAKDFLSKLITH